MLRLLSCVTFFFLVLTVWSAEAPLLTADQVQNVRKLTEAISFADAREKNDVLRILDETLSLLNRQAYFDKELADLQLLMQTSEAELRKQLTTQRPLLGRIKLASAPQSELERIEQSLEQLREEWQAQLITLNAELAEWSGGGRKLIERLNQLREELDKLAILPPMPPLNAPILRPDNATILLKYARKQVWQREAKLLQQKLANADKLFKWAQIQKDHVERQLDLVRAEQEKVVDELRRRRELSARSLSTNEGQSETAIIESEIAKVLRKINEISAYRVQIVEALEKKNAAFQRLQQYMEAAPESAAITRMLRDWLQEVPEEIAPRGQLALLLQETAERHLQLQLAMDDDSVSEEVLEVQSRLAKSLSKLIAEIRQAMEAETRLISLSERAREYAKRALLWRQVNDLSGLLHVGSWQKLWSDVKEAAAQGFVAQGINIGQIVTSALLLLLQILLISKHARLQESIVENGRKARKIRTDSMALTWKSLLASILLAFRWPGLFLLLGGILVLTGHTEISRLAAAITMTGITGFFLEFFRVLAMEDGVGHRHFRWSRELRSALREILKRYAFSLSIGFGLMWLGRSSVSSAMALPQIVGCILFNLLLWMGAVQWLKNVRLNRMDSLFGITSIVLTTILIGMVVMGYTYAAIEISVKWWQTLLVVALSILLRDLVHRMIYISRRRVKFEEAVRRFEERKAKADDEESAQEPEIKIEEQFADVDLVSQQANRLLTTGVLVLSMIALWMIWRDFVPALQGVLNYAFPLTVMREVDGVMQPTPLTTADLLLALLMIMTTVIVARNLPGLVEMLLLNHSTMDHGLRYAVVTLVRYAIWMIGVSVIASSIGFRWSEVQWLVAAIGVGLGFGLQEIVANFVSGLVLLFERPIRVGDTVTLDTVSGVVSRIRIRATTITTFDRQEYLVPNKDLITGRMINWTLSDRINRLKIEVGIAYGSDLQRATEILLAIAREHPLVMEEPKPDVLFVAFGDNAIILQLRVFYDNLEKRWELGNALGYEIYRRFNEAGIVIAFPQRDVHLDVTSPIPVRVLPSSGNDGSQ